MPAKKTEKISKDKKQLLIIKLSLVALLIILAMFSIVSVMVTKVNSESITKEQLLEKLQANTDPLLAQVKMLMTGDPKAIHLTSKNYSDFSGKGVFPPIIFSDNVSVYGFEKAEPNDYMIVYDSLIVVYNYDSDDVKSVFTVSRSD